MKKLLVVVLVVAIALMGATAAMAAILGSKHDLANDGTAGRTYYSSGAVTTTETCVFCHTAHGSNTALDPIWNRPAGSNTFVAYGNTMAGTATMGSLAGSTQLCLSCHDGSTALNVLYNNPGSGNTELTVTTLGAISGVANLTADMTNDHPIGVVYDVSAGVAGMKGVAGVSPTPGIVKINGVNSVQATSGTDEVHCSSCHDVHNMANGAMLMPFATGNAGSQLCITCHDR